MQIGGLGAAAIAHGIFGILGQYHNAFSLFMITTWWGKAICDSFDRDWLLLAIDSFMAIWFTQKWWRNRKNKRKWIDLATGLVKDIGHRLVIVPVPKGEPA